MFCNFFLSLGRLHLPYGFLSAVSAVLQIQNIIIISWFNWIKVRFFKEFVDRRLPDESAASYPKVIDKTGLQDYNYVWQGHVCS